MFKNGFSMAFETVNEKKKIRRNKNPKKKFIRAWRREIQNNQTLSLKF